MSKKKKKRTVQSKKVSTGVNDKAVLSSDDRRAAKKAVVLGTEKRNRKPLALFLACVVIIVAGAFYFMSQTEDQVGFVEAENTVNNAASQIAFPVSLFDDGTARYFQYTRDNITIRYFALKSSDGIIRAAFDACDVCWRARKGYYQEGDVMVCRNCGQRFASVLVNEVRGGCNPAPLDRTIEGDRIIIQTEDIIGGKGYFDFSGRT